MTLPYTAAVWQGIGLGDTVVVPQLTATSDRAARPMMMTGLGFTCTWTSITELRSTCTWAELEMTLQDSTVLQRIAMWNRMDILSRCMSQCRRGLTSHRVHYI